MKQLNMYNLQATVKWNKSMDPITITFLPNGERGGRGNMSLVVPARVTGKFKNRVHTDSVTSESFSYCIEGGEEKDIDVSVSVRIGVSRSKL